MEKKFTSGEWLKRRGDTDNHFDIIGPYGSNKTIACLPARCFVDEKEAAHNADLIAAAPDLAMACYSVLQDWHAKKSNFYKKEPHYLAQIREALKKAGI